MSKHVVFLCFVYTIDALLDAPVKDRNLRNYISQAILTNIIFQQFVRRVEIKIALSIFSYLELFPIVEQAIAGSAPLYNDFTAVPNTSLEFA